MKWQIRQIPANFEDDVIKGLYFITNGNEPFDDRYFCRDGVVRNTAVPVDKTFKRVLSCYHNTKIREMYLREGYSAFFAEYEDCVRCLRKYNQEYTPGVTSDRLTKGKRRNEQDNV